VEPAALRQSKLSFWETTGSVLWFAMDSFWMLEVEVLALGLILPTLLSNLLALRYIKGMQQKLVTWALVSWLAMNVAWMVADIRAMEPLYPVAKAFTALGFLLLLVSLLQSRRAGGSWYEPLRRFRRLRIYR
jgi:hypothetical protein